MEGSPTTKRRTGPAATVTLTVIGTVPCRGMFDRAKFLHRVLNAQGRGSCAPPVIAVEPTSDGIAAESDNAAAVKVYFRNQRFVDLI